MASKTGVIPGWGLLCSLATLLLSRVTVIPGKSVPVLYHATNYNALRTILQEGLTPRGHYSDGHRAEVFFFIVDRN